MHQGINEYGARNHYAAYSLGAARFERCGEYDKAETLWRKAAQSPCNALHRLWAEQRAEFCANAHLKGWKPSHESEDI